MDLHHLRRAIALAAEAREHGDPPFGSLLVSRDGEIVAEDRNTTRTDRDITAHPELKLARWAARELDPDLSATTTMYTSCQPCPMCASAIAQSGLGRVVYALSGEQLGAIKAAASIAHGAAPVVDDGPHLLDEASRPFDDYYSR